MYEEDVIFGPFNLKQTLALLICAAIAYVGYRMWPFYEGYGLMLVGIVAGIVLVARFKSKMIPLAELDRYFEIKKAELGPDKYMRYLQKKHATILSQIEFRKQKGLIADPDLAKMDQRFRSLIDKK